MEHTATLINHQKTASGLHEIVLLEESKACAAQAMDLLDEFAATTPKPGPIRVLLDFRQSGIPPVNYAVSRGRALNKKFPDHAQLRIAYVYDKKVSGMVRVGEALFGIFFHDKHRMFSDDQYDDAVAWALADD